MQQYLDLMQRVLTTGAKQMDRTGTGTLSVFGHQMRFDLADGFPALTTKKLHLRSIIVELLWFLRGDTNVQWLRDRKVSIWDEWADEAGELGRFPGPLRRRRGLARSNRDAVPASSLPTDLRCGRSRWRTWITRQGQRRDTDRQRPHGRGRRGAGRQGAAFKGYDEDAGGSQQDLGRDRDRPGVGE